MILLNFINNGRIHSTLRGGKICFAEKDSENIEPGLALGVVYKEISKCAFIKGFNIPSNAQCKLDNMIDLTNFWDDSLKIVKSVGRIRILKNEFYKSFIELSSRELLQTAIFTNRDIVEVKINGVLYRGLVKNKDKISIPFKNIENNTIYVFTMDYKFREYTYVLKNQLKLFRTMFLCVGNVAKFKISDGCDNLVAYISKELYEFKDILKDKIEYLPVACLTHKLLNNTLINKIHNENVYRMNLLLDRGFIFRLLKNNEKKVYKQNDSVEKMKTFLHTLPYYDIVLNNIDSKIL